MTKIKFGTDGWRAIIAKDFTVDNVARVTIASTEWVKKNFDKPSAVVGHDCRFAEFERLFFGSFKDLRMLAYAASAFEIATHYNDGDLWFKAKENYLNSLSLEQGSSDNPSSLSFQNMGSLPVVTLPHEDACANYRVANENDAHVSSMSCPFEGGQVSWLNYNSVTYNYRKYTSERIMYGLGMIMTINQEGREFQKPITDSFNDYSIKEDL